MTEESVNLKVEYRYYPIRRRERDFFIKMNGASEVCVTVLKV